MSDCHTQVNWATTCSARIHPQYVTTMARSSKQLLHISLLSGSVYGRVYSLCSTPYSTYVYMYTHTCIHYTQYCACSMYVVAWWLTSVRIFDPRFELLYLRKYKTYRHGSEQKSSPNHTLAVRKMSRQKTIRDMQCTIHTCTATCTCTLCTVLCMYSASLHDG